MLNITSNRVSLTLRRLHRLSYSLAKYSTETNKPIENPEAKKEITYDKPLYATKRDFDAKYKNNRENLVFDRSTGYKPSNFQRMMLVVTGLYSSSSKIPEYVSTQTIQRLHDRNRVVFIIVATSLFFIFFLTMEYRTSKKIIEDRAAGKIVTKMS